MVLLIQILFFSKTEPNTEYKILVIAFTLKHDGEPSDLIIQRTDVMIPSAPQIINLTCHSKDSLFVQWRRPTSYTNSLDFYMISYQKNEQNEFHQSQLDSNVQLSEMWVSYKWISEYTDIWLEPVICNKEILSVKTNTVFKRKTDSVKITSLF